MFFKKPTHIHLLMCGHIPAGAYLDKALADADCWVCNEGVIRQADDEFADSPDYWVKTVPVVTLVDEFAQA